MSKESTIPPDKDTEPGGLDLDQTFMDLDWDDDEKTDVDIVPAHVVHKDAIVPPEPDEVSDLYGEIGDKLRRHATIIPKDSDAPNPF